MLNSNGPTLSLIVGLIYDTYFKRLYACLCCYKRFTRKGSTEACVKGNTKGMEKIINKFFDVAGEANDFLSIIGYQWVLNASENTEFDILDAFLIAKAKGA